METQSKALKITVIVLRSIMGLIYVASAIVVLLDIVEPPADLPARVQTFQDGMEATGYLLYLIKITELVCGLSLISGRYVALSTVMIFPITLNIFLYHVFVYPDGLILAVFLLAVNLLLAYVNGEKYRPLFKSK